MLSAIQVDWTRERLAMRDSASQVEVVEDALSLTFTAPIGLVCLVL